MFFEKHKLKVALKFWKNWFNVLSDSHFWLEFRWNCQTVCQ